MNDKIKICVVGGGTGTFTVLRGIKSNPNLDITAIVTSADSGGSTGILRDEFGILPVGDFRQCLVALSKESKDHQNILRELFDFRFERGGKGLEGHNFGNLLIMALTEILGSPELAFNEASKILNVNGRVYPVTFDKIQLVAEYEDGSIAYGEKMIDSPPPEHDGSMRIRRLWVQPHANVFEKSKEAIEQADYIVLGPGDLYTSILANVVVDNFAEVIKNSKAKIIGISNLMSKFGQTDGFKAFDFVKELERYIQRKLDYVILNNAPLPTDLLDKYKEEEKAHPIIDDLGNDSRVNRCDLLSDMTYTQSVKDKVRRSLLRHSSRKIASEIDKIILKHYI